MAMSKTLLDALACPKCRGSVRVRGMFVTCSRCGLAYPILEKDIPSMITDEAWTLEKAKKASFKHSEKL